MRSSRARPVDKVAAIGRARAALHAAMWDAVARRERRARKLSETDGIRTPQPESSARKITTFGLGAAPRAATPASIAARTARMIRFTVMPDNFVFAPVRPCGKSALPGTGRNSQFRDSDMGRKIH